MIWTIKNFINKYDYLRAILIILALFWLDQITKYFYYNLKYLYTWSLITPVFNKWISWWVLLNLNFINLISVIALIAFIYFYIKKNISLIEFVLLVAWTIWNLVDRLFLWWVRDFIDFHFWPVFNFADMYLTFAVIVIIYREFFWHLNITDHFKRKNKSKNSYKNH